MNSFAHLHVLLLGLDVLQAFAESDDRLLQGREMLCGRASGRRWSTCVHVRSYECEIGLRSGTDLSNYGMRHQADTRADLISRLALSCFPPPEQG